MARILVVEDDEVVRAMQVRSLKGEGYEVFEAANGLHAWQLLQRNQYDLVVTDSQMPFLSGLELIQLIKRRFPKLLVIRVTGSPRVPNAPPPIVPTFCKPFDLSDLTREVKRILDQECS
jgi:CheY-like chemotaxis protein